MTPQTVLAFGQHALEMTLMLAAPLLLTALVVGLVISILQAATQLNEATLSFVPKLIAVFVAMVFAGPWMLRVMVEYLQAVFAELPGLIG